MNRLKQLALALARFFYQCWQTRQVLIHGRQDVATVLRRVQAAHHADLAKLSGINSVVRGPVERPRRNVQYDPSPSQCVCGARGPHSCSAEWLGTILRLPYSRALAPGYGCPFCRSVTPGQLPITCMTCGALGAPVAGSLLVHWTAPTEVNV